MNEKNENQFQSTLPKQSVLLKGLDEKAIERLLFRVICVEATLSKKVAVFENGNIAKLEPEVAQVTGTAQDLANIVREFLTLLRQEQGVAPPPNPAASGADGPGGP